MQFNPTKWQLVDDEGNLTGLEIFGDSLLKSFIVTNAAESIAGAKWTGPYPSLDAAKIAAMALWRERQNAPA